MVLDSTIQGLGLLKSAAQMVPIVGFNLEAAIDIIIQSCQIAKVRKPNSGYVRDQSRFILPLGCEDEQIRLKGPE
jgi:hypothetical protein